MLIVPLQPVASQVETVTLAGQVCSLALAQRTYPGQAGVSGRLYLSLSVGGVTVLSGVPCLDRVRLVRDAYLGFTGDLAFADTQGTSDPYYTGLGSRFLLIYLEAGE